MTIRKIRKATGYSYSTISRVLNGMAKEFKIADSTAQTIIETAERLNYRPNLIAQSLRKGRTMTVGLVVSDIQNPVPGELVFLLERLLRSQGYSIILCNTNDVPEDEESCLRTLFNRRVDGVFLAPIQIKEWNDLMSIKEELPIVLLDSVFLETDLPWVTSNNTQAAAKLTEELIAAGCQRLAYLGGKPDTYINDVRFKGFRNAIAEHALNLDDDLIRFKGYSIDSGKDMMAELLQDAVDFDGVFCVNDCVFLGAHQAMRRWTAKNTGTLRIAAFDVARYADLSGCPVVSADQDLANIAQSAVSLLLNRLVDGDGGRCHFFLPTSINRYHFH